MTATPAPGVHDVPEDIYHADKGSLSVSGAKKLLPPSCPALFKWERDNGQPHKAAFNFGHAAHAQVLGVGQPLQCVMANDWRTNAAKEQRDQAYATGAVPLLEKDWITVQQMAAAILAHPIASALFDADRGKPEQSLYMRDPETFVMLRARLDWLPEAHDGRMVVADYKTAQSAEPRAFARAAANFGYHMQAAWYQDMALGLGLADDVAFVFVAQEKTAPYLISVVELDAEAIAIGRRRNRQAIDTYARCVAADHWPSYSDGIELLALPKWATYDMENVA